MDKPEKKSRKIYLVWVIAILLFIMAVFFEFSIYRHFILKINHKELPQVPTTSSGLR